MASIDNYKENFDRAAAIYPNQKLSNTDGYDIKEEKNKIIIKIKDPRDVDHIIIDSSNKPEDLLVEWSKILKNKFNNIESIDYNKDEQKYEVTLKKELGKGKVHGKKFKGI